MQKSYHITLYAGERPDVESITMCHLNMNEPTVEGSLSMLRESGLNAADLRSKTLFHPDSTRPLISLLMYTALLGFAGRKIDFTDGLSVYDPISIEKIVLSEYNLEIHKESEVEKVLIGPRNLTHEPEYEYIDIDSKLDYYSMNLIKQSKDVIVDITNTSSINTLLIFNTVASLRAKNSNERLPKIAHAGSVYNLEEIRKACNELRRSTRTDDRDTIVDKANLTDRELKLLKASRVPIEKALTLLGSEKNDQTDFWRCPRPTRHKNGDANPSLKISEEKVRCFRCDQEPIDSLRLVVDSLGCSPDDAAKILLELKS